MGYETTLWGRQASARFDRLLEDRGNEFVTLQPNIELTTSLSGAVSAAEVILVAIGAQGLRGFLRDSVRQTRYHGKIISLNMKGLEASSGKTLSTVTREELGEETSIAVWVGPGHVQDLAKGVPTCMVVSAAESAIADLMMGAFSSELIRLYANLDLIGTEVGAALKNVLGIAAGMLDGLGLSSLKGPLMARGAYEVAKLIKHLGGDGLSAYGLAHMGDFEATLFSRYSRNRMFGESFATGKEYASLAEGVSTLEAISNIDASVDLPIISALIDVVKHGQDARSMLDVLFERPQKGEFLALDVL